jgi:NhaP-type Na+/H+ or K+/H+ antiporter
VSLAAALALPLTTSAGQAFPQRNLIIFMTFGVIFATLVLQGLTLPWLIRRLGLQRDDGEEQEELRGRLRATDAALARLEELAAQEWTRDDTVERMRGLYQFRRRRLKARGGYLDDDGYQDRAGLPACGVRKCVQAARRYLNQTLSGAQSVHAAGRYSWSRRSPARQAGSSTARRSSSRGWRPLVSLGNAGPFPARAATTERTCW